MNGLSNQIHKYAQSIIIFETSPFIESNTIFGCWKLGTWDTLCSAYLFAYASYDQKQVSIVITDHIASNEPNLFWLENDSFLAYRHNIRKIQKCSILINSAKKSAILDCHFRWEDLQ